jgi:hypothetical protein
MQTAARRHRRPQLAPPMTALDDEKTPRAARVLVVRSLALEQHGGTLVSHAAASK